MKFKFIAACILGVIISNSAIADGLAIYTKTCAVCHTAGVAGAPKLGDKAAWAPRISTGVGVLVASVSNGKGAMPPKGTCMDCSEADLKAAVDYMVDQSK